MLRGRLPTFPGVQPGNGMRLLTLVVFAAVLLVGVAVHRDYGLSFDEPTQREIGAVTLKHLVQRFGLPLTLPGDLADIPAMEEYRDSEYGIAFETPLVALEALFGIADSRDVYRFRHLMTFLFCLAGAYALYCLAYRRFGSRAVALLGVVLLYASPRMFAESFYNDKDAVFMAAFAIATNSMVAFVLRPGLRTALLHALTTALAIDIRIAAIILPAATVAILCARLLRRDEGLRCLPWLAAYFAAATVVVVALWPWLWADIAGNFAIALASASKFRFDNEQLYMGTIVRSTHLPWHYVPVWIAVTTPILQVGLFVVGVFAIARQVAASRLRLWRNDQELQDLVFLALFSLPILAVIALDAVLYNGWRHLYFVFPPLLLVALRGGVALWQAIDTRTGHRLLLAGLAAALLTTASWMWRAHPFQNVYFSVLAGDNVMTRFEGDYWGLGNQRALEYLLEHDKSPSIAFKEGNYIVMANSIVMLPPEQRARVHETEDETPHYAVTSLPETRAPLFNVAYQHNYDHVWDLVVAGEVILRIYRWSGPPGR
jgi:Dolichyl-phosphate-mannose-protein mannosyltransferase